MNKYILRWQKGVTKKRIYYTYGSLDVLRKKAEELKKDSRICYITIDKIYEVVKDTREEEVLKFINNY